MKKRQRNVKKRVEEQSERRSRRIPTTRYDPDPEAGLTSQQVQEHRMHGGTRRQRRSYMKMYLPTST